MKQDIFQLRIQHSLKYMTIIRLVVISLLVTSLAVNSIGLTVAKSTTQDGLSIYWVQKPPDIATPDESFSVKIAGHSNGDGKVCLNTYPGRGWYSDLPTEQRCHDVSAGDFEFTITYTSLTELTKLKEPNFAVERYNNIRFSAKLVTRTGFGGIDIEEKTTSDHYLQVVNQPVNIASFPYEETVRVWIPSARPGDREYRWLQLRVNRRSLPEPNVYRVKITVENVGENPDAPGIVAGITERLNGNPDSQIIVVRNDSTSQVRRVNSTTNGQTYFAETAEEISEINTQFQILSDFFTGGLKGAARAIIKEFAKTALKDAVDDELGSESSWNFPVEWTKDENSENIRYFRADFKPESGSSVALFPAGVTEIEKYTLVLDVEVTAESGSSLLIMPDMRGKFYHQTGGAGHSNDHTYVTEYRRQLTVDLPYEQATSDESDAGRTAQISSPSPSNGATAVQSDTILSWSGPEDATFHVYLEQGDETPDTKVASDISTSTYSESLEPGTTYYWKVVAHSDSGTAESDVWSFRTAGAEDRSSDAVVPDSGCPGDSGAASNLRSKFDEMANLLILVIAAVAIPNGAYGLLEWMTAGSSLRSERKGRKRVRNTFIALAGASVLKVAVDLTTSALCV